MKIAILDDYYQRARDYADWDSASFASIDFIDHHIANENDLVSALQSYDAIGVMRERTPFPKSLIDALPNLKLIVTSGKQNAAIDVTAAAAKGVTVCGTPSPGHATAELAFLLVMTLCRKLIPLVNGLKQDHQWQPVMGSDLRGKTLGILGLGRLGSQVAALGQAIGMDVVAWSANLDSEVCQQQGVEYVSKTELFERSDFVSIHLRLSERSRDLVTSQELNALGPDGYIVNTSRAEIIRHKDLLNALNDGSIAGLATDVLSNEPAKTDDPILMHPRTLVTPHVGYCTEETFRVFYSEMLNAFKAFHRGEPINIIAPKS
ncbi:D-2-hydroxyacid dehydrogenase family protein [Litoricolaceae bacterium]|nr:D-2-hydroxyacid dehydrogenase family protein [Litorivicinaceae bacterium]